MKTISFDSGIIQTFRVFSAVKLFIAVLPVIISLINLVQGGPFPARFPLTANPVLPIIEAIFLLGYLSWPWLKTRLGKIYLPLAIAVATLAPIASNIVTYDSHLSEDIIRARNLANQWELIILLIVPLIFVSWQYNFRIVIVYSLGLAIIDLLLSLPLPAIMSSRPFLEYAPVLFRTSVFLLVGYIITRLVTNQREQTEKLRLAYRELANYSTTNEQLTLSRERNRLARELHDTLAHTLSAVAVQLEAVSSLWENDRNQAHSLLQQSLKLTRDGLSETRRAIQALRAAPVEEMGLVMAFSNLVRSFAERYNLNLSLEMPEKLGRWEAEVENSYYRITEEALRNVANHSGASNLWVSLSEQQSELDLTIRDDGRGFDIEQAAAEDRFGLQGMRERAHSIGAQFQIDSEPGKGTTIVMRYKNHKT